MANQWRGRLLHAVLLAGAVLWSGCRFGPRDGVSGSWEAPPVVPRVEAAQGADAGSASRDANHSRLALLLASDAWVRDVPGDGDDRYRWRHLELERLGCDAPSLAAALGDPYRSAALNAAILLARAGDEGGKAVLAAALEDGTLRAAQRCAAAEALAMLPEADEALRSALARCGEHVAAIAAAQRDARALPEAPEATSARRWPAYDAALHAELVRSVAQRSDPAHDAQLRRWLFGVTAQAPLEGARGASGHPTAVDLKTGASGTHPAAPAITAADAEVRLAALQAWSRCQAPLPDEALLLQDDPDPRVRAELMKQLARSGHRRAVPIVVRGVRDAHFPVSREAMAALTMLPADAAGRDEAVAVLRQAAEDAGEGRRAAAIEALARLGDAETVLRAADDSRWVVRRSVARALRWLRGPRAAQVARLLVRDPSPVVRREAVESLAPWPVEEAGPIWLEVLGGDALQPRIEAARLLAARWEPAAGFPVHADAAQRAEHLAELRTLWADMYGNDGTTADEPLGSQPEPQLASPEGRRLVEAYLGGGGRRPASAGEDAELRGALVALGPALPELLWQAVQDTGQPLPEELYRAVLPEIGPEFAALRDLEADDVSVRRRAADALWALAGPKRLPPLVLHRLVQRMPYQSDALVWRSVQLALGDDERPEARYVAHAGLSHPHPEVRRRACEHLQRHGEGADAARLAGLLDDTDPAVRLAAVRALGRCGTAAVAPPLERLLASESPALRAAAAESLMQCDAQRGAAALRRLTYDGHADVRRQAAEAMGRHGRPEFVAPLVRLLADELEVRRAALRSLAAVAGYDAAAETDPASTTDENRQIAAWKRWYERGGQPAQRAAARGGVTSLRPPAP